MIRNWSRAISFFLMNGVPRSFTHVFTYIWWEFSSIFRIYSRFLFISDYYAPKNVIVLQVYRYSYSYHRYHSRLTTLPGWRDLNEKVDRTVLTKRRPLGNPLQSLRRIICADSTRIAALPNRSQSNVPEISALFRWFVALNWVSLGFLGP